MHLNSVEVTGDLVSYRFSCSGGRYYKVENAKIVFIGKTSPVKRECFMASIELHFAHNPNDSTKGKSVDGVSPGIPTEAEVLTAEQPPVQTPVGEVAQLFVRSTFRSRASKQRHSCEGVCGFLSTNKQPRIGQDGAATHSVGLVTIRARLKKTSEARMILPFHEHSTRVMGTDDSTEAVGDCDSDDEYCAPKILPWTIPALEAPKQKRPRRRF